MSGIGPTDTLNPVQGLIATDTSEKSETTETDKIYTVPGIVVTASETAELQDEASRTEELEDETSEASDLKGVGLEGGVTTSEEVSETLSTDEPEVQAYIDKLIGDAG